MVTTRAFTRDPASVLDYQIDWSAWLGEDTIDASSWDVDDGITQGADSFTDTTTTLWLSGGTVGERYTATNRITTAAGRIDERTISITVRER